MIRQESPKAPAIPNVPVATDPRLAVARALTRQSAVGLSTHLVVGAVALGGLWAGPSSSAVPSLLGLAIVATGIPRLLAARSFLRRHPREPARWGRAYRAAALLSSLGVSLGTALLVPFIGFDPSPRHLLLALAGLGVSGVTLIAGDMAVLDRIDLRPTPAGRSPAEPPVRDPSDTIVTPASETLSLRTVGTVLVAEDVPANQVLLATYLRKMGAQVKIAENGRVAVEDALAAVRAGRPYDVILMDMQMPELDGYAATGHLRREGYRGAIVAVTAHAMRGDREKCIAAGCDDYLTKPIDRRALVATVERLAAHARARTHLEAAPAGSSPSSRKIPLVSELAGDPDMEGILSDFLETLDGRAAALQGALLQGDRAALKRLAHQLKGVAGGYGFPSITEEAKSLESALSSRNEAAIASEVDALCTLCLRARDGAEVVRSGLAE